MRFLFRILWPPAAGGALLLALAPVLPEDIPGPGLWILLSGLAAAVGHIAAIVRPAVARVEPPPTSADEDRWREAYESLFLEKRELLDRVEELSTMREVALTITSVLEFRPMVETILEVTSRALESESVALHLAVGDGRLDPVAGRVREGAESESGRSMNEVEISAAGARIRSLSWERISAHAALFRRDGDRTHLYVPLAGRGEALGVLEFARGPEDPAFTERDREKATSLAGTVSVALTNARLYEMAVTDGLTGLYVHRHFQHRLAEELRRAERTKRPVSLLLVDIDHFKKFNDTHGHPTGDLVLAGVAAILRQSARAIDLVARYGGEEMTLVLPETDAAGATLLAERIRASVEAAQFESEAGDKLSVTVSIGVATSGSGASRQDLIKRSDAALYVAKHAGRNRVESAPPAAAAV